jgi:membrane peptidoglycan carboxypeptidase
MRTPFVVRPSATARTDNPSLDLSPDQLSTLRRAMIAVVEQGTGRVGRLASLQIAGKTGTAQNSHGPDHGWFIAFGPAEKPEIVVGAIVEFVEHGTAVAPLVARTIAHYLGIEDTRAATIRIAMPADSAPEPFALPTVPADTVLPPIPTDSAVSRPPTR